MYPNCSFFGLERLSTSFEVFFLTSCNLCVYVQTTGCGISSGGALNTQKGQP